MSFCAICASDRGPLVERQLGPGEPRVKVCKACDEETPIAFDSERGYEPHESAGPIAKMVKRGERRVVPTQVRALYAPRNRGEVMTARTPGYLLLRVPRRAPGGRAIDHLEAAQAFADKPWASEVRYLGPEKNWHLFERPDVRAVAKQRQSETDPLAAIAKFKVG
ncbi:MAG TPA: hypothetical protein VFS06_03495 [Casimicrobiaceae bacterium]|nr:hypothetical protein [Casimicrobiaceae bacterium]